MSGYHNIIYNSTLYPKEMINKFGAIQKDWETYTDRRKELIMCHIMSITTLCNMEILDRKEMLESEDKKRRREHDEEQGPFAKKSKDEVDRMAIPSTSTDIISISSDDSKSTSTSKSTVEEFEDVLPMDDYRFHMARYMSTNTLIIGKYCKEWDIPQVSHLWDMVDVKSRKFIDVVVTSDFGRAKKMFIQKSNEIPLNSSLLCINPYSLDHEWIQMEEEVASIDKLKSFLLKRKTILASLNMIESDLQTVEDLEKRILTSSYFNDGLKKWTDDWEKEIFRILPNNEIYGTAKKTPRAISILELKEKLTNLNEKERKSYTKYKGKLYPEGFTENTSLHSDTDLSMVSEMISILREDVEKSEGDTHPFFQELIDLWEKSENNFTMYRPSQDNSNSKPHISSMLGIGKKKRSYNPEAKDMKQKKNVDIPSCKYHTIFEEIFRRLNNKSPYVRQIPHYYLLETPPTDDHPIANLAEEMTSEMLKEILSTNSAIMSSKYTNMFSRIGGSYGGHGTQTNKSRDSIAIFPIYATLRRPLEPETVTRICTGLMIRGPIHAKSPTDRIPIITIETLPNNRDSKCLISLTSCKLVLE